MPSLATFATFIRSPTTFEEISHFRNPIANFEKKIAKVWPTPNKNVYSETLTFHIQSDFEGELRGQGPRAGGPIFSRAKKSEPLKTSGKLRLTTR